MSWTVADAVDYKGFPADKSRTGGWVAAALILGIEICERLSTMGIIVNLVTYLVGTMHLPSSTSANIVTDFAGTSFLLCLLGGFLADSFLGRYKTIAIFASIQALEEKDDPSVRRCLMYENYPEASRIDHTDQLCFLDKAAIVAEGDLREMPPAGSAPNPWNLYASVTRVEEMITFSVVQASTMDRSIGKFQIPAGSLTVFFVLAIMITLAVNDRLIMPLWRKWKGQPGFTNLQRIAIGLVLSTLGMAAAALTERKRLSLAKETRTMSTGPLPISVFLLIPQFFLVGSGEAFIYTGQLDFFITQSPKGMKTMSTGLFLSTLSLGFFVSSFLVSIVTRVTGSKDGQGWLADNINYGRLDCFYGLLSVLSVINFVAYLVCARWYKSRKPTKPSALQIDSISIANGSSAEDRC
ncbi:hypothetical protein M0R45_003195 [Rubus argutus]|uniref:Uncharacterized protein n=1 Tax=Rubus argutus TaxID=59490 RepID=A0AAW1YIB3_RUBAR